MRARRTTPGGPGAAIILDNGGAGTSATGAWTGKKGNQAYGADYLLTGGGSGSSYRWTQTLNPGAYEVYVWWVSHNSHSSAVPYTLVHDGQTEMFTENQRSNGGQWVPLGTYDFAGDGTEYLEVSDAGGKASADAVRFVERLPGQTWTEVYYAHNDHLGTPWALTDAAGATVWRADYDPFGAAAVDEDVDGDGVSVTLNVRFPGQYYDSESGLHYNYFRYYDPQTGRYITSDPIGLDGGLNTFGYALNNPLIYFDPLGLVCRQTARRGMRCSPGPGRGGGRVGVFGCLIGCVSFTQGDSEAQDSLQPTIGGGLSLCSAPKEPEPSCEDEKEEEKDCGIYDPNCDDELNFGVSPTGRAGFLLSLSFNEDGSVCVNVGPHTGLPGPAVGAWRLV